MGLIVAHQIVKANSNALLKYSHTLVFDVSHLELLIICGCRGSKHILNDDQEGQQTIDIRSMAIKRKDYHSNQGYLPDNLKNRRMTDELPQNERTKYDERKHIQPNKMRYNNHSNHDVCSRERERMRSWNSRDDRRAQTKKYEEYDKGLNRHHSVSERGDNSSRQGDSRYRQRSKRSADMYLSDEDGTRTRKKNSVPKANDSTPVHRTRRYGNYGSHKVLSEA